MLREVAYRVRSCVRAFEAVYRIGGKEFVVVLTGVSAVRAADVAERILTIVRSEPIEDVSVTIPFGVVASAAGAPFDYDRTFAAADANLHEAKRGGRDRVSVDSAPLSAVDSGNEESTRASALAAAAA